MPKTNRVTLNDRLIHAARVKPGRASTDLFDAVVPGLVLRVTRAGRKTFYIWFRDATRKVTWLTVRDPQLTTHEYPVLTLARAREVARDLLERAGDGADLKTDRQVTRARTFGALAAEYVDKYARPNKKTWRADAINIKTQLSIWHARPVAELTRSDVRALLDGIVARGAKIRANRVHTLISGILNFGLDREWIEYNVAARMTPPAKETKRSRRLSADEIRMFWQWASTPAPADSREAPYWRLNRALLKLRLITAARGGELLAMRWADLDWSDRDHGPWWTQPADTTKNGLPHRVPLTAPAIAVLRELEAHARDLDGYVFAGILGKAQRRYALVDVPLKDFRPRDMRRTVTTNLASLGVDRFTVKRILNHVDSDVTADYDYHAYGPEKRAALEQWATRLETFIAPPTPTLRLVGRAS